MQFLRTVKNSIYSPEFYRALRAKPLSFSLKYFYSLAAIVAIVVTVILSINILPQAQFVLTALGAKVVSYFPENLEITLAKGAASSNVAEPYFLKTPSDFPQSTSTPRYENLLVIDTVSSLSLEKFKTYNTISLLSKNYAVFAGKNGEIRVYPLEKFPDLTINKAWVEKVVGNFTPYFKFVGPILVLFFLVFVLGVFSIELVYLFFSALLIWAVLRLKGIKARYGEAYRTGVHAITLGILLHIASIVSGTSLGVPFLFTILMLVVVAVNCKKEEPASA